LRARGLPMPIRLATVAVVIRDYDEAIAYYTQKLGFELTEDSDCGNGKRWVTVRAGTGIELLLAKAVTPEQESRIGNQTGGRVFLFLETDDFARDYELFTSRGVRFLEEPRQEQYGTVAVFVDLYGNKFDLIQTKTAELNSAAHQM
jgi:catechol 2,3-dioxygenase-like lactoylglutathione lyase family enzyme